MANDQDHRTILLTGVTRGLGRALMHRFIERGHTVWGCGRDATEIAALGREYGSPHDFAVVDVSQDAEVQAWAKRLLGAARQEPRPPLPDRALAPDLLINNAGVINRLAPLWEIPAHEFDQLIDVNLKGVANVLRHFVPAMVKRPPSLPSPSRGEGGVGVIVNFSSGWGRSTSAEVAPYCASKYAIEGLTKALAEELPTGMAAVPLNPGIIDTDMLRICFQESAGHYPDAEHWSHGAADYILALGPTDNGLSRTIPQ